MEERYSSREFRGNQAQYFNMVDNQENLIIQRGKNKSYRLLPVTEDDTLLSKKEYFEMLDKGLQNIREGKTKRYTMEELRIKMGL